MVAGPAHRLSPQKPVLDIESDELVAQEQWPRHMAGASTFTAIDGQLFMFGGMSVGQASNLGSTQGPGYAPYSNKAWRLMITGGNLEGNPVAHWSQVR